MLIGSAGRALTIEGLNTSKYCFQMASCNGDEFKTKEEMFLKHKLISLAKQAESRRPRLTANGLSILGKIASNVCAYTILIIQFYFE